MDLRGVDLNLLVILDALLDERHVTRAAHRLGLSQPAASSALDRCRHLFGDKLLEREKGGMRATPAADRLRAPLKAMLTAAADLIAHPAPNLSTVVRTVRIITADYPATIFAPLLYRALANTAPGVRLVFLPWRGGLGAIESVRRADADLAISVMPDLDADFRRETLLEEHYVVAMRAGHPAGDKSDFNLESWLAWPHILVSSRGEQRSGLDDVIAKMGRRRRIGITLPNFMMVGQLLRQSDLIATLPSRSLTDDVDRLRLFDPPFPTEGFSLQMAYHQRSHDDVAVQYVAKLLRTAAQNSNEMAQNNSDSGGR